MKRDNCRSGGESRRSFLKRTSTATLAVAAAGVTDCLLPAGAAQNGPAVLIVPDAEGGLVTEPPVRWAIEQLRDAFATRGIEVQVRATLSEAGSDGECIFVAGSGSPLGRQVLASAGGIAPQAPEALAIARGKAGRRAVVLACGSDAGGLVYALLELTDRVRFAADPLADLKGLKRTVQQPANRIRSVARLFASDVEDKGWFNDRGFWERYFTELATHRFNRFNLTLGLGYDFTTNISDCYFHFAYPFLISPPGYHVRAVPLPDEERERNLMMLKFASEQAARRGLHFQLGLWTHAYRWTNSPNANYVIEGLTPETQGPYCRAALEGLLRACPAISGVTLRIHGESGVAEGSYDFWKTLFEGAASCGRRVELDLHAKGIDDQLIESALATGLPVTVAPKYWAEHMGLGYMQGAIRPQEMPPRDRNNSGFFALSSGSRQFLRYGYGDLLTENRRYRVLHRLWPGTQRLLLWGNPELAADYGRVSSFCGSAGMEWMESLSFKGRKGSGLPGGRNAYADNSLRPAGDDFEKYAYGYRVWGRHLYDPDCSPEEWQRGLRREFGGGASAVESALREAGAILPLFTTAHCPSAANNNYWPEMYWNMPIVNARRQHPYSDTPTPKRFGAVSPLDPEFFSRIDDFAEGLLKGEPGAKYSPAWVAASLEARAEAAKSALAKAGRTVSDKRSAGFRRMAADVTIQSGLGQFFAWKLRAGVLFAIYDRSQHRPALEQAIHAYRTARAAWAELAEGAKPVYRSDVTFGPEYFQRGHWVDRLPAIEADLEDMEKLLNGAGGTNAPSTQVDRRTVEQAIDAVLRPLPESRRPGLRDLHVPAKSFRRGEAVPVEATLAHSRLPAKEIAALQLRFRRVNQGDTWQAVPMQLTGVTYRATIPANYTDSPFPLQYHFELRERSGAAWLYPGLKPGWQGQPYFVIRQA